MRLVRFSVNHHVLPVILSSMVTVFHLNSLLPYFLCISRLAKRSLSQDSLTVLDDWNPLIWRFLTEAFSFTLKEIRSLSISSYYFTSEIEGGCTWHSSSWRSRGGGGFLTSILSFKMYLFPPLG